MQAIEIGVFSGGLLLKFLERNRISIEVLLGNMFRFFDIDLLELSDGTKLVCIDVGAFWQYFFDDNVARSWMDLELSLKI